MFAEDREGSSSKRKKHQASGAKKKKTAPTTTAAEKTIEIEDSQSQHEEQGAAADDSLETELNWDFLEKSWPREERPSKLQHRKHVAKLSSEKIRSYYKLWKESQKAAEDDEDGQIRDARPKEVNFREGPDDGFGKLHPARFCRFPLEDPQLWWHKTPTTRRDTFLSMPLDFCGLENCISDVTIKKMHKKTEILTLKHFYSENVSVTSRSKKETRTHNSSGSVSTTMEYNWFAPTNLAQTREAVFNFASLNFYLYPFDPTGLTLLRILNRYDWMVMAKDEKARVELIKVFFDLVLKKSAHAALNNKCVPSHKQQEDWLKEILARNSLPTTVPEFAANAQAANHNTYKNQSNRQSNSRQGDSYSNRNSSAGGGNDRPKRYPHWQGVGLCIDYNKAGGNACRRPAAKDNNNDEGCKEGNKFYLHQCSQWIHRDRAWCNKKHPRKDCRFFRP